MRSENKGPEVTHEKVVIREVFTEVQTYLVNEWTGKKTEGKILKRWPSWYYKGCTNTCQWGEHRKCRGALDIPFGSPGCVCVSRLTIVSSLWSMRRVREVNALRWAIPKCRCEKYVPHILPRSRGEDLFTLSFPKWRRWPFASPLRLVSITLWYGCGGMSFPQR